MRLGLPAVNVTNELESFVNPTIRVGRPTDGLNWIPPGHIIVEVTAAIMNGKRSEQNYSYKTDFESRRKNQDFGSQNISMSRPPLDLTPFGTNTTNGTMSPIDSITVRENLADPTTRTKPTDSPALPTDSSKRK